MNTSTCIDLYTSFGSNPFPILYHCAAKKHTRALLELYVYVLERTESRAFGPCTARGVPEDYVGPNGYWVYEDLRIVAGTTLRYILLIYIVDAESGIPTHRKESSPKMGRQ